MVPGLVLEPNDILHSVCQDVDNPSEFKSVAEDMLRYICPAGKEQIGIGLAAPQFGIQYRFMVLAVPGYPRMIVFNPHLELGNTWKADWEGCLSIPGKRIRVERATKLKMRYQTIDGAWESMKANDLLARAIQHEEDHLNGILITDKETR